MKMMNNWNAVVIINGSGGCGKSEFAKICRTIGEKKYNFCNIKEYSTISIVKEYAKLLGWQGEKTEKDRKFLSDLKKALELWNNSPENSTLEEIKKDINFYSSNLLFVNIREPYNIDSFKEKILEWNKKIKIYTVLIKRDNINLITSNDSDKNVNNYEYDFIIYNNGTKEQLAEKANNFLREVFND